MISTEFSNDSDVDDMPCGDQVKKHEHQGRHGPSTGVERNGRI